MAGWRLKICYILKQRARKRKNHLNCGTVASSASVVAVVVVVAANRFTASCVGVDNEPFNVCVCMFLWFAYVVSARIYSLLYGLLMNFQLCQCALRRFDPDDYVSSTMASICVAITVPA